jgi:hypothetical protein
LAETAMSVNVSNKVPSKSKMIAENANLRLPSVSRSNLTGQSFQFSFLAAGGTRYQQMTFSPPEMKFEGLTSVSATAHFALVPRNSSTDCNAGNRCTPPCNEQAYWALTKPTHLVHLAESDRSLKFAQALQPCVRYKTG